VPAAVAAGNHPFRQKVSQTVFAALDRVNRLILIFCNLSVMLIVVAAAVMRYWLNIDFYASEEILMIFAFWLYFMGAVYGSYEKSHVEADFMLSWLGDSRSGLAVALLRDLIELAVLIVLTYWAFLFVQFAYERWPITPGWRIPLIVPQSAILVGFMLMTIHALRHLVLKLGARHKTPPEAR